MAANIENNTETAEGASVFVVKKAAWHKLGKVLDSPATAEEAIKLANLNYEVDKSPNWTTIDKEVIQHDNSFSVYRTDNNAILASRVGSGWTPLQNKDAFGFFDAIVDKGDAVYHSAGVIGKGEKTWLLAKLPEHIAIPGLADEEMDRYVLLVNGFTGFDGVQICSTNVRTVCENTMMFALRTSKNKISIPHVPNIKDQIEKAARAMGIFNQLDNELLEVYKGLSKVQLKEGDVDALLAEIFPKDEETKMKTKADEYRNQVKEVFESSGAAGQMTKATEGTAYGLLNAMTFWTSHVKEYKDDSTRFKNLVMNGTSARKYNQKLFDTLLPLVN